MTARFPYRDALRILFILVHGAEQLPVGHESGAQGIFRGEARLHAFDFWMRNPDYLAEELLDEFERSHAPMLLQTVEQIFADGEPDVRKFPMIRYRFGAYEPIDDAMAVLRSRALVAISGRKSGEKVLETNFLIAKRGFELADEIENEIPALDWYPRRARLVAQVAAGRGGDALKTRQYEQAEYSATAMKEAIPSIAARVLARLREIKDRR